MSWWMLKNSSGKKDSMLSFAVVGLIVTSLSVMASTIGKIVVGANTITFNSPDTTLISAFLGATLIAYIVRKNKKEDIALKVKKLEIKNKPEAS